MPIPSDTDEPLWEMLESSTRDGDNADPALRPLITRIAQDRAWRTLFERLQATDAVIAGRIRDVPLPSGLAERLIQRLGEGEQARFRHGDSPDCLAQTSEDETAPVGVTMTVVRSRPTRRWLLVGGASLIAAASVMISLGLGLVRWQSHSGQGFVAEAVAHFVNEAPPVWSEGGPPEAYPMSRDVRFRPRRWRPVTDFLGYPAVAYELPPAAAHEQATLYVVRAEIADLPSQPPARPMHNTGNCVAAAWQRGDLVYVLVVTGGEGALRRYLAPSSAPMA